MLSNGLGLPFLGRRVWDHDEPLAAECSGPCACARRPQLTLAPVEVTGSGPKACRLSPLRVPGTPRGGCNVGLRPYVSRGTFRVRGLWDGSGNPARIA